MQMQKTLFFVLLVMNVCFPAELLAAVKYFDQRQDREQNRQQFQSDEVRERISFLELQAQVKLNISLVLKGYTLH